MKRSRINGWHCFLDGFRLLYLPSIRPCVLIPVCLNTLVAAALILIAIENVAILNQYLAGLLPQWLAWLSWIVEILSWLVMLSFGIFTYSLLANLISAPFNALLAEAVQKHFQQTLHSDKTRLVQFVMQTFGREWAKFIYLGPRWLLLLVLGLVPGINLFAAPLWILFGGWAMTLQYADYAAENNAMSFSILRYRVRRNWRQVLTFGLPVYFLLAVPLLNIILIPAAVAGGTRLWMEHLSAS